VNILLTIHEQHVNSPRVFTAKSGHIYNNSSRNGNRGHSTENRAPAGEAGGSVLFPFVFPYFHKSSQHRR